MPEMTKVAWDLSDLFSGVNDPEIEKCLDTALARAKEFAGRYRGKIDSDDLTAQTLLAAIRELEELAVAQTKVGCYAALVFSADTGKAEHGALMQHVQERGTEIALELLFFELELMSAKPEIIDKILEDDVLANYRHFVHASRLFRDHKLPEAEERILEEKANTGGRAFERLFDESVSDIEFSITIDGEERTLTEPEVLALLKEPDRELRRAAAASLTQGLVAHGRLLTFIFNTLVYDKAVDDRLRRYEYPEQARNLSNELDRETVETVISTCVEGYPLVAQYYRVKRDVLGLDKLYHYDRYAPLFESKEQYTYDQAREIILESFGRFSGEIRDSAVAFFENGWIDAAPRKAKRGGAFCMYVTPDLHPYVLMSYLNRKDDITTLGHELGHGVHASLSRGQTLLNFSSALPVAELASTFGEMLVFESLVSKSNLEEKLALYAEKIEGIFATIFRQAAMYRFEQELHNSRRELGELTTAQIGEMWQRNVQSMFGDSVELGEEHANWWMYVSHFIGSPFYVYAYSFGELLVMALYSMYRREGASFVPKYLELLKTGGACSPEELLRRVGIDVRDPEFWRGGMKVVEGLVADFEKLYAEWKEGNR
jgi:oligoendopeptidase F